MPDDEDKLNIPRVPGVPTIGDFFKLVEHLGRRPTYEDLVEYYLVEGIPNWNLEYLNDPKISPETFTRDEELP